MFRARGEAANSRLGTADALARVDERVSSTQFTISPSGKQAGDSENKEADDDGSQLRFARLARKGHTELLAGQWVETDGQTDDAESKGKQGDDDGKITRIHGF